jgi:hypothetical protein
MSQQAVSAAPPAPEDVDALLASIEEQQRAASNLPALSEEEWKEILEHGDEHGAAAARRLAVSKYNGERYIPCLRTFSRYQVKRKRDRADYNPITPDKPGPKPMMKEVIEKALLEGLLRYRAGFQSITAIVRPDRAFMGSFGVHSRSVRHSPS